MDADGRTPLGDLVPVSLPDGTELQLQVVGASGMNEVAGSGTFSITDLTAQISSLASALADVARTARPDHLEIEFSVAAAVRSGRLVSVLVDGEGSSTLTLRMAWDRPRSPSTPRSGE